MALSSARVTCERIDWSGWSGCMRASNGEVDLVVTGAIGPRIMRYGFAGGQNMFRVYEDQAGKSGESEWQLRGGHRIWAAPEDWKLTYAPDNVPVELSAEDGVITATSPIEPTTGLRKQLVVTLAETGTGVKVLQRLQNTLPFAIQLATWSVTMFPQSGVGVTGFPPRTKHEDVLAPSNPLVMWGFTDLRDKRWTFLEKYLVLRQDPDAKLHTKLGHFNVNSWGAFFLKNEMFLKRYTADRPGTYPDMGCSFEMFACSGMLELETLGPISTVESGAWLEHTEAWSLYRGVNVNEWTDEALDDVLSGKL